MTLAEIFTVIALITGPTVAVWITLWHQNRSQKRAGKERLFGTLMAHRRSNPPKIEWANALNLIDVIYADHPTVVGKWHELYNILSQAPVNWTRWNHVYIELLSEMAMVLGYRRLQQVQIDQFYSPQAHGDQAVLNFELQTELLRVLKATQTLQVTSLPSVEMIEGKLK